MRTAFENFRIRAETLAGEIGRTMPEFTVHDITHIDALWENADMILDENDILTPAEVFVLGATFLIHDLGMGLAAFPGGLEDLMKEPLWTDTAARLFKEKYNKNITETDKYSLDKEIEYKCDSAVLRQLHASKAEQLALTSWKDTDGKELFLLDNSDLRGSYGHIIGRIAHSHWWATHELLDKLPSTLGAPGNLPSNWTIDPVKIACLLRVSDAMQIDDRRAPSFLRAIRKPVGESLSHWNFQQKLYQPRIDKNRVVFASKSPFEIQDADSWWICHDTLQMIDNEIKEVDSLLADTDRTRLNCIGVASIEDLTRLSKLITVKDWFPTDTRVKVSNVGKLARTLGGEQLYGKNAKVPLRELIQNASDAIRARRMLENESDDFGLITIRINEDEVGVFLEVEDNGIGMSREVLTGPLLDFGQSFWGTSLMHKELPGLESMGFVSTGEFGIGFYSTFMLSEKVSVSSNRSGAARESSLTLDFQKGLESRPILRKSTSNETLKNGGTKVRIYLSEDTVIELLGYYSEESISFEELIEILCPALDCNVDLDYKNTNKRIIKANDWISIPSIDLIKRIMGRSRFASLSKIEKELLKAVSNNLRTITEDDGTVSGRVLIYGDGETWIDKIFLKGVMTIGGLYSCNLRGLVGVLVGKADRASRDSGIPIISPSKLSEWATSQSVLLSDLNLEDEIQMHCAGYVRICGGYTGKLKILFHQSGALSYDDFLEYLNKSCIHELYMTSTDAVYLFEREHKQNIKMLNNVIWFNHGVKDILQTTDYVPIFLFWPECRESSADAEGFFIGTEGLVQKALCLSWECEINQLLESSETSTDTETHVVKIGTINDNPVILDVDIMRRPG